MPWALQASICYYYRPQREGERIYRENRRREFNGPTGEVRNQWKDLKTVRERERRKSVILFYHLFDDAALDGREQSSPRSLISSVIQSDLNTELLPAAGIRTHLIIILRNGILLFPDKFPHPHHFPFQNTQNAIEKRAYFGWLTIWNV